MKTIREEVDNLKDIVAAHLKESGVIQTKLDILMKFFWRLVAAGVTFNVLTAIAVLTYILNH